MAKNRNLVAHSISGVIPRISANFFATERSHHFYIAVISVSQFVAVILASVVAKFIYIDLVLGQDQELAPYLVAALILAFVNYLFFKKMGLLKLNSILEPTVGFGRLWGALGLSFLIFLGILYLFKVAEGYSRGWFLCWFALSAVAIVITRWHARKFVKQLVEDGHLRQRVAVIGTADLIASIKDRASAEFQQGEIQGIYEVADGNGRSTGAIEALEALRAELSRGKYDRVVVALPFSHLQMVRSIVRAVSSFSVEVLMCTDSEPYPLTTYGSRSVAGLHMAVVSTVPAWEHERHLKYMLDYTVAAIGLVLVAPLFAIVALAIKLESPGPVFFRQRRYGRNNSVFRIFKFRTMTVTEDGAVVTQAVRNDARVTYVGRLLRATSLDELPQLINVLLGDMSIVGPRPHAIAHDERFEADFDLFSRRRRVRPGITGWAQVHGYRGETRTLDDVKHRMEYDLYYIDNWSIWLDIEIMARTLLTVTRGAY